MNSKLIILVALLCSSCGVKSPPLAPEGSILPSYQAQFNQKPQDEKKEDKKKDKKVDKSE